jgi:hypothetical protein
MNNSLNNNIIVNDDEEQVLICSERLKKLELLEAQLPSLIEAAINEHKINKLKMLHEKDKQNPGAVNKRVKRYNERHKEEINSKRRAKRLLEKEMAEANKPKPASVVESLNTTKAKLLSSKIVNTVKTEKNKDTPQSVNQENSENKDQSVSELTPPNSPTLNEVLTVRFDI